MDDSFNDHFMEHDAHKVKPVHQETPQEREDREIEESTISRRHNKHRIIAFSVIGVLALIFLFWMWNRYYHPYAQGVEKGYIMEVSNEGSVFKTLEFKMITRDLIMDTVRVKWVKDTAIVDGCNFSASLASDSLAREAVKWKGTGKPVVVTYDEYSGTLPWRGNSKRIVTSIKVDTVAAGAGK